MERSQKKIHWKDELTWPAHILTCSPHVLSHVLALNGTSLLDVKCPCKNQAGWPFWCPYRNVFFSAYNRAQGNQPWKAIGKNKVCVPLRRTQLESLIMNVPRPQLNNFKVSVSQFKMSKCLGLAKKNTSLTFSQTLAFTIHRGGV